MKKADVQLEIKNIIIGKFNIEQEIDYNTLLADIGIDSLKVIELVLAIEEQYGFEFEDDKLSYQTLRSIDSISEYVFNCKKEGKI